VNQPRAKSDVPHAGNLDPAVYPTIAFSDADWDWFLGLAEPYGVPGRDEARSVVERLYGHLVGVNAWFNLTRITDPRGYLKWHLLDSLSLWPDRRRKHLSEGAPCLDLGSGGGYPGLPLSLFQPKVPWVLVDSRKRKVDFMNAAAGVVGSRVEARHFRGREVAKAAPDLHRRCQLVVSRAAGPVDRMLGEIVDMLAPHGCFVIYKGPGYSQEEHEAAMALIDDLGLRFVTVNAVQLEPEDPERLFVVFERVA